MIDTLSYYKLLAYSFPGKRRCWLSLIFLPDHQVFQTYLSSLISPGQRSKPRLLEACKTLAILYDTCYQLNKKRKEEFVPLSDFYNEDLSLKMDFKKEYEHWRTLQESNRYLLVVTWLLLQPQNISIIHTMLKCWCIITERHKFDKWWKWKIIQFFFFSRSQSGQKLSLLDYPFLFDPTSKVMRNLVTWYLWHNTSVYTYMLYFF